MKILIDIGHPAHVHYFRNFIRLMTEKGHKFCITARDKEVTFGLLNNYNIPFTSRGKGGTGVLGKLLYLFKGDWIVWSAARKFKPDIFLSFASPYAAHAAFLVGKPHIALDDTEVARYGQFLYRPFTTVILSPMGFNKSFGHKHFLFNSFMELCALHPKYFITDSNILKELNVKENQDYIVLRFVSWNANHDLGQKGLSLEDKKKIINALKDRFKLFISSEEKLPEEFMQYNLQIKPEKIHHVLAYAKLYIGEGATMASESAMLGTPAVYINPLKAGTIDEQEKWGVIHHFLNSEGVLDKVNAILDDNQLRNRYKKLKQEMLMNKFNPTDFLVWFIDNYPLSRERLSADPDY